MKLEDESLLLFVLPVSFSFLLFLSVCLSLYLILSPSIRFCGHLSHYQLYQHQQSLCHAGGGALGQECSRERVNSGALYQDQLVSRQWGGHMLPQGERDHALPQTIRVSSSFCLLLLIVLSLKVGELSRLSCVS